ncbi:MAG: bacteriophage Gp15 family protein [Ruminococcus bromii]|nr:bacteriophage Gp15 family protein [Ruminococcus bromii]
MLTDSVPESLTIAGTEYEINTDYSVWLKFEMLLSDEVEDSKATLLDIKKLIFKSELPPDRTDEETTEQILWFYRCGKPEQKGGSSSKKIFDYDYDDGYICAAYMEQYHIDISGTYMHWWKFHALMLSLSENTEFVKIMGYRAIEINSKMTAAQKAFYQKMKKHYKLPVKKEEQQRITAIEDALINGEPIDNLL